VSDYKKTKLRQPQKKEVADKMFSFGGNERQITFHYYLFALERGARDFHLVLRAAICSPYTF